MKEKLLILASTFPANKSDSTPAFVLDTARHMQSSFEVHVLTPRVYGSSAYEQIEHIHIHRYTYAANHRHTNNLADGAILPNLKHNRLLWRQVPPFFLFQICKALQLMRKYQIRKIHAHWILPQGLIAVVLKQLIPNVKVLITSHGTDVFGLQKVKFLKKIILQRADAITAVSTAIESEISKICSHKKIIVLPMGTDISRFQTARRSTPNRFNLLFVGRLSEIKGISYLIDAMSLLKESKHNFYLQIIGSGEEYNKLHKKTQDLELTEHIHFLGGKPHDECIPFFKNAHIFIGPSLAEGFGLVFVEAIAAGCITISSDISAVKDIVIDGVTGFLTQQKNAESIAQKITYVMDNYEDCQKQLKDAHTYISKFDSQLIGRQYIDILRNM